MQKIVQLSLILLLGMFAFTGAYAGDVSASGGDTHSASSDKKDWKFNLAPFYLWAISIDGDATLGANSPDVSADFGDIIDRLDAALIVNFQGVYQNKWGFVLDYKYLSLSDSGTIPVNIGGISFLIPHDSDFTIHLVELDGFYRVTYQNHDFDFKFGGRYTSFDPEVKIGRQNLGEKQNWVDPLIGMRWIWHFAERWKLFVTGDIGGFGIGSSFSWQAGALVDWQPFKHVSFVAGYRALYQDYEDGTSGTPDYFNIQATYHGPLLGVSFRW